MKQDGNLTESIHISTLQYLSWGGNAVCCPLKTSKIVAGKFDGHARAGFLPGRTNICRTGKTSQPDVLIMLIPKSLKLTAGNLHFLPGSSPEYAGQNLAHAGQDTG